MLKTLVFCLVLVLSLAACAAGNTGGGDAGYRVSLETQPAPLQNGRLGQVVVRVQDKDGQPVRNAKVSVKAQHRNMNHGSTTADAQEKEPGVYQGGMIAPMTGDYDVTVTVEGTQGKGEQKLEFQAA